MIHEVNAADIKPRSIAHYADIDEKERFIILRYIFVRITSDDF